MKRQALQFRNVEFAYDSQRKVLHDISFSIAAGEKVALTGLNGSGKSTLLLHANGLLLPDSGSVSVFGREIDRKSRGSVAFEVGMVFQNSDDQLFMPTVEDDVAFGPRNMGLDSAEIARRVDEALAVTGTSGLRHRPPFTLSGGEKRMVALATVLSMNPSVLVLDEPTSALDCLSEKRFVETMERLEHTVLMSTHNLAIARRLCTRAILMYNGRIAYDGPISELPYPPADS